MKTFTFITLLILSSITIQAQNVEGTYTNKWVSDRGEGMEYTLTLQDDGNFTFYYTRMYLGSHPDKKVEVNGNWRLDGHLLVLNTVEDDSTNSKFASELNANKAKFVSVSPRNPRFNLIKPSLEFFESDVFYLKNMELVKTESSVSSSASQAE